MFTFLRFAFLFILTLVVLVFGSAWLGVTYLAPRGVTQAIYRETDFPAQSSKFSLNPLKTSLSLDSFVLQNSSDFQEKAFVDIHSAHVILDPSASRGGRLVLDEAHLGIRTLTIVRNAQGEVNAKVFADRVLALFDEASGEFQRVRDRVGTPKEEESSLAYLIKTCHLALDRVVVIDYKDRNEPYVREFDLSFDLEAHDVSDLDVMISPLIKELKSVAGSVVVDAVLYSVRRLSLGLFDGELLNQTGKVVEGAAQVGGKVVQGAATVGGKAIEGAGKVVQGLLGSK